MNDPRRRLLPVVLLSLSAAPAFAATCESVSKLALPGTTIVSAHNTQDKSLGYLIRIDGRLVEQEAARRGLPSRER